MKAFGLNRSELHTQPGLAEGVTFPRVLGSEAAGIVAAAPGGEFAVGMAAAVPAKDHGPIVPSTTRRPECTAVLTAIGVDHVLIDGSVANRDSEA